MFVSGDFFRVLGVPALRGRVFTAADDRRGCGLPGAVISYAFWQREFAGDPSVIGRKLTLNYQPVEMLGLTPAGFSASWLDNGTVWWLTVMGRRKPRRK
jgi:hypothetical protein